jgi:hypothetical protein
MDPNGPVNYPVCVMLVFVAVGLVVRGRWRLGYFFAAYLAAGLGWNVLVGIWPDRFFTAAFFMIIQAVYDILKLGLVLEMAWRTFRVFPGARAGVRAASVALLVATILAAVAVPLAIRGWDSYETALGQFHPLVLTGTIWLIVVVLAAAKWYRVPVHPFHTAVLTSLAAYLAAYTALLRLLVLNGFDDHRIYGNVLDRAAYLLLTSWWAYVVWRPQRGAEKAHAGILRKVALRTSVATP